MRTGMVQPLSVFHKDLGESKVQIPAPPRSSPEKPGPTYLWTYQGTGSATSITQPNLSQRVVLKEGRTESKDHANRSVLLVGRTDRIKTEQIHYGTN